MKGSFPNEKVIDPYDLEYVSVHLYVVSKKNGFSHLPETMEQYLSTFFMHSGGGVRDTLNITEGDNLKKQPSNKLGLKLIDCQNYARIARELLKETSDIHLSFNDPTISLRYIESGDMRSKRILVTDRQKPVGERYSEKTIESPKINHAMLLVEAGPKDDKFKFVINTMYAWPVSGNDDESIIESLRNYWEDKKTLGGVPEIINIFAEGEDFT